MPNLRRGMMAAAGAGGISEYQLWGWGDNTSGCLGTGDTTFLSSPVQIGDNFFGQIDVADEGIIATGNRIYGSYVSSAAVKGDGTLWTWGINTLGKLGIGDTTVRSSPVQVGSLTDWRSVAIAQTSMCASKTDGTLWGWGATTFLSGQAGNVSSPVQIGSDTDWTGVFSVNMTYSQATLGIKTNGQMYMWGGNVSQYASQTQFTGTASVLPVAIDDKNYVNGGQSRDAVWAIDNTGKLWAWGVNSYGKLGLGDTTSRSSPVQVGSATDWVWVSGDEGGELLVAANSNGEIWAAGRDDGGELGLESVTAYSSPVQIGGPGGWSSGGHGMAQTTFHAITDANGDNTGGALWSCGAGSRGVLGDGTDTTRSSPVQIGSDTTWVATTKQGSNGMYYKLAIKRAP